MTNKELEAVVASQKERIKQLEDMVMELNGAAANSSTADLGSVKVDGKDYDIMIPGCNFNGAIITAEDVKTNNVLAAQLVEIGSGMLKLKEVQ